MAIFTGKELLDKHGASSSDVKSLGVGGVTSTPTAQPQSQPFSNKVTGALGLGGATQVFGQVLNQFGVGVPEGTDKQFLEKPTAGQVAGAVLQTGATVGSMAIGGPASLAGKMAVGAGMGYLYDVGSDLTEQKSMSQVLTPGGGTAVGLLVPPVFKGAGALISPLAKPVGKLGQSIGGAISQTIPDSTVVQGTKQVVTDIAERVPRAMQRGKEAITEAAQKQERIRTSPPNVQQALKVGLDEVMDVDVISRADEATKTKLRQMVHLADAPKTGFRPQAKPASVAGDVASEQYDLIEKQRKAIGKQIGDISDRLSTKPTVDITPLQKTLRETLTQNNIIPDESGQLIFRTKRLTPAQQKVVQDLYQLTTTDKALSPRQIHEFDQLFSKLQREARFIDKIDDVYVTVPTPDGTTEVNIFKAFRDMYSQHLDAIAPEIKPLNKEYRTLSNLTDDLENSIFKSGNFETTGNVNDANYAKTNLRRMFSNAQSASDYEAIYENLDAMSRSLGYQGARADELAGFAIQLQKLYPETVAETSLEGGVIGALKTVFKTGKANTTDQQKALKALLDMADEAPNPSFNQSVTTKTTTNADLDKLTKAVDKKLALAPAWKRYIDTEAKKIVASVPNTKLATAPLKGKDRIIEKTIMEEGGNLENIKDIARNTIIPLDAKAQKEVIKQMNARYDIATKPDGTQMIKHQTPDKFMGYEGYIYNIRTPDGLIMETQVVTPQMTYGKNSEKMAREVLGDELFERIKRETGLEPSKGHEYYEQWRGMSIKERQSEMGINLLKTSLDYYKKLR
jgi:hypothetical protein